MGQQEKYDLLFEGINTMDILSIASIPSSNNNDYTRQEIRQLPEPTIIRFNARNFDEVNAMLYLYQSLSGMGSLTPFEIEQNTAYKIIHNNYEIPDEIRESEFYKKETGVISSGVEYHILKYRYRQGLLTADEDRSFWALTKTNTDAASEVLMKELDRGNNNKKYSIDEYNEILRYTPSLIAAFQEERLSYTKVPVYWNLERYLHILLGHVSILQIGEYFRGKTPFQYEFHDIKDVVKNVLSELSEQINLHFDKFPQKDFTRHGGMAHYYRGDYYIVRIRPDGLLMQFIKTAKPLLLIHLPNETKRQLTLSILNIEFLLSPPPKSSKSATFLPLNESK